jgi:MOSC domain-containing protein YiiM
MVRRFAKAGRPGAYLRIVGEGEVGAGDPVRVAARPDHGITVAMVARAIVCDHALGAFVAAAPALPPDLAQWLRDRAHCHHPSARGRSARQVSAN